MSAETPNPSEDADAGAGPTPVLVAVAWPYANGLQHLGHIAGAYLPADIYARYRRLRGDRVLMVSGSDAHGTPITVKADTEGVTPAEIVDRYHPEFLDTWDRLGITFDRFTTTRTDNHHRVARDVFSRLVERGYVETRTTQQSYDATAGRFLPDRYVEGTCPHCGYEAARGDQCENCGRTLDPDELVAPRSRLSGATPELRDTEHAFLLLSRLQDDLAKWLQSRVGWRRHVINWSLQFVEDGLHDRAITRDLTWGIPVPEGLLADDEDKRIYVWFEAVIGYLSASIEWAADTDDPEIWRDWWQRSDAESYYFIGKDNIPFHTVIWPAILLAHGELDLPTDVPANQYVTFKGAKASKSAGVGRTVGDYLALLQPDALRYALACVLPEQADTELGEDELVRRINEELVAIWGNLVNRVLSMTARNFGGAVPDVGEDTEDDRALLATVDQALAETGRQLGEVELRAGLRTAFGAASEVNAYLNRFEPWKLVKTDRDRAGAVLRTALGAIAGIDVALAPYLPHSAAAVAEALGIELAPEVGTDAWARPVLAAGSKLGALDPLFTKVDDDIFT